MHRLKLKLLFLLVNLNLLMLTWFGLLWLIELTIKVRTDGHRPFTFYLFRVPLDLQANLSLGNPTGDLLIVSFN